MPVPTRRHVAAIALLLVAATTAACGSKDDDADSVAATTTTAASTFPVTIDASNGKVVITERPVKIVSLSPTATEMLFAVGAGSQVIAVDDQSDYPAEVPKTDLSGYQPNIEAIAAKQPDLVVASGDANGLVAGMAKLSIPILIEPSAVKLDDSYAQIRQLGAATGHKAEAAKVAGDMQTKLEELAATAPKPAKHPTYYHELDDTLFTVTSKTFIGQIYAMAGLDNIADAADKDGSGYPQLSAEALVKADPDFVFLADTECCKQDASTFAARPGLANLKAVKGGHVVTLSDDVASRWGPRIVDLFDTVVKAVNAGATSTTATTAA